MQIYHISVKYALIFIYSTSTAYHFRMQTRGRKFDA